MTPRVRPQHGFLALGLACTALAVQHFLMEGFGFGSVLESFITLSITGLFFYSVIELPTRDVSASNRWWALKGSIGTAVAFASLAGAIWVTWWVDGQGFKLSFLLSFATNLGALVGVRASIYAAEAEERLTEAQELTKLLSINQRVLRHNIRNELSVALGYLERLEAAEDAEEVAEDARVIRTHLEALLETSNRTRRIIDVWQTDDVEEFDLSTMIREQLAEISEQNPDAVVTTDLPTACRVTAHTALPLAFEEAIRNAITHNPSDVGLDIRVHPIDEEMVRILISDTGGGIPRSEREILENPRETPLEHTEGVGLWMIYWIVTRSGGTVEFTENEPRGTTIRIELPRNGVGTAAGGGRVTQSENGVSADPRST